MSFDTIREYLMFCVFWTLFLKGLIRKNRIFELVVPFISRNQQSTIQSIRPFFRYKSKKNKSQKNHLVYFSRLKRRKKRKTLNRFKTFFKIFSSTLS